MEPWLKKKLASLDPKTRKKIDYLFREMHESISILYDLAIHDEKTGLYNNKFFQAQLDMEFEKAQRGKQTLSLMILDIDYFKKVNDAYGHIKGDEILIRLARVVQNRIRGSDIAARFGGEEFILLLPETTIIKAKKLAARLKKAVHTDPLLKKYKITVSAGVTQFRKKDTKRSFKIRADKALYQAKKTGRDKFIALR